MTPDYGFTDDQIVRIMGRTEKMNDCCREVFLKAVAFLDDESTRLGTARDNYRQYAHALARAINTVCDAKTRRDIKVEVRRLMDEAN